jgi:hypothetical protein
MKKCRNCGKECWDWYGLNLIGLVTLKEISSLSANKYCSYKCQMEDAKKIIDDIYDAIEGKKEWSEVWRDDA